MSPASRPDTRNCLNSLPPSFPPPLWRLSIRPVAQTDGSFGQASLQGPETSVNVLNRSLRCFLPNAAFDSGEGAYRPGIRPRVLVQRPHTRRFRRKHLRPLLRWSLPGQEFSKRLCFHGFMESVLSKTINRLFIFSFQESVSRMEHKGLFFCKKRRVLLRRMWFLDSERLFREESK